MLPSPGATTLYLGCGTSAFVAHAAALLREGAGAGHTDWAFASEGPIQRTYDTVVAFSRSGTTTEVLQALRGPWADTHRVVVTGDVAQVPPDVADEIVDLGFADEESVVQTRFPTTLLLVLRHLLGEDVTPVIAEVERVLAAPLDLKPADYDHFVFLARGWAMGLADEAALKMREAAQAWAESYPALDYRHGPIAAADARTLVAALSTLDALLQEDVRRTGATLVDLADDPLVRLVQCQRLATELAGARGLNPDVPRHLTRSVVLPPHGVPR
jgi:fructoselysine-6-P-deglycase FrlB-like protein